MTAAVSFRGVGKRYAGRAVLDGVDLDCAPGRITALCGPPAAGKSVLLRLLVGLETPDAGRILVSGTDVTLADPGRRKLGYVPQSFALFPQWSVFDNIAYPLTVRGMSRAAARSRVERLAALLGLEAALGKRPDALSGGQKQRAALARGLVREADAFVLDDPLVGLDFKLRERLVDDLKRLRVEYGAAFLYATSDSLEALAVADDIAVLDGGRVVEHGPAEAIYHRPQALRSAEIVGFPRCNVLPGTVDGDGRCRTALGSFRLAGAAAPGPVSIAVRPEHFEPATEPGGLDVQAVVRLVEDLGAELVVHFDAGGGDGSALDTGALVTVLPAASAGAVELDGTLPLSVRPDNLAVFAPDGARLGTGAA